MIEIKLKDPVVAKEDAIRAVGNAAKLARLLGLSRSSVSEWGDFLPPLQAYRLTSIYPSLDKSKN
jgi:DNA-binding transcriptional regulator YdaS (Cro superfamily)